MLAKIIALAAVLALLLAFAACSSGDDDDSASGTATATKTAGGGGQTTPTKTAAGGGSSITAAATETPATSKATTGTVDACDLLTQDEVLAATGADMGPGQSNNDGQQCLWDQQASGDQLGGLEVSINIDDDPEVMRELEQGGSGATEISGVGDEAFIQSSDVLTILNFKVGGVYLDVSVMALGVSDQFPSDAREAMAKTLALKAIPRIP